MKDTLVTVKSLLMDEIIQSNRDYDLVDPAFYEEEAKNSGGDLIAQAIGNILQKELPIEKNSSARVLDVASGTGIIARTIRTIFGCQVEAMDLSSRMLQFLSGKDPSIPTGRGDMNNRFPYQDKSFDAVVTHWANRFVIGDNIAREAYRLLNPGGIFVWPFCYAECGNWRRIANNPLQLTYPEDFEERLQEIGFDVKRVDITKPKKFENTSVAYPTVFLVAKKR